MPQKELSSVEVLRFLRNLETVKPGVSAGTEKSLHTGIGKLVIEMLPQGELEAFFLLLGGIYCSPLGTIKPVSPAQSHALTSFMLLKWIRLPIALCTYQTGQENAQKGHTGSPAPPVGHFSPFPPKGAAAEQSQTGNRPFGDI